MDDRVADTLLWAALAALGLFLVSAPFIFPWGRKKPRPPEQHPAE
jgi:hypothetical protein